jgi:hypothetical protein
MVHLWAMSARGPAKRLPLADKSPVDARVEVPQRVLADDIGPAIPIEIT